MLTEKIKKELQQLANIGKEHGYKINAVTFFNIFAGLPEAKRTDDILDEMKCFLNQSGIELITDEVEIEDETVNIVDQIQPFNPKEIDISMDRLSMDNLIKRIQNEEVNLNTEFQRKSGLWSNIQKSQLIESLLLNIPLPAFYFDASKEDNWLIIDGLQRITALKEFIVDKTLKLTGLEFFHDLEGITFDKLPRTFTRRIEETNIIAYKINPGTPVNVKYNIFKRINTGGLELTTQEIRHALYQGKATAVLKELTANNVFLIILGNRIRKDRMQDHEFVLRFIAVCYYGIDRYNGLPEEFLNETMDYINKDGWKIKNDIKEKMEEIFDLADRIFGRYAFRKMATDSRLRPINKAVYEIWCRGLFELDYDQRRTLIERREIIQQRFIRLCESDAFLQTIKASDRGSFLKRMNSVSQLIKEVLNA
ncbi:DUF262 domain-containing protein [[Clostridium] polysaccharolyticum]|uniref:GmrSD restriction endonucleases N-terminal domain-containing protein n=1 Tax=[Clostridium] polysaccharolyticum TaxID=29364 RepID=A0A1I0FQQ4_9FIRM|nr:DUF262 domain-containing protein [[Clostridium] polysaccharolyticum]SET59664.1 Protein of unknown function DUF262 [[Clostridium] polysaccharolyticum]